MCLNLDYLFNINCPPITELEFKKSKKLKKHIKTFIVSDVEITIIKMQSTFTIFIESEKLDKRINCKCNLNFDEIINIDEIIIQLLNKYFTDLNKLRRHKLEKIKNITC